MSGTVCLASKQVQLKSEIQLENLFEQSADICNDAATDK